MFTRCQQNYFGYEVFVSVFNMLIEQNRIEYNKMGTVVTHAPWAYLILFCISYVHAFRTTQFEQSAVSC